MYPITEEYKQKIQQPARQFAGRVLIPKLTATFTRNSIAYKQDGTQVGINEPRFEEGQFGKAVMVEEGTENLFTNSSFEIDNNNDGVADGWMLYTGFDPAQFSLITDAKFHGKSQRCIASGSHPNPRIYQNINTIAGNTYTASAWVKAPAGKTTLIGVKGRDGVGKESWQGPTSSFTATGDWQRIYVTYTHPTDGTAETTFVTFGLFQAIAGDWILIDGALAEQKPYPTSYIDGTRSSETLTIPTAEVLNPQEGTVECWVYVNGVVRRNIANNWPTVVLIRKGSSVANWIWLHHNPAGTWVLQIRKEDGTITGSGHFSNSLTPDGWHYFAIRWNTQEGSAELFHNGVKRISLANVIFPAEYDRIDIGHRSGGSGDWFNGLIDDLRISQRARTDEEILETYGRWL